MVSGSEDVVDEAAGKGSEVPDGLHPGVRPSDLPERGRPIPKAQLQPFHGRGEPVWSLPEGTLYLPREQDTPTPATAWTSDKDTGRQAIC